MCVFSCQQMIALNDFWLCGKFSELIFPINEFL